MKCPTCSTPVTKKAGNPRFPFCNERCRLIDLGKWANEEYRVAGEPDVEALEAVDRLPDPDRER